MAYRLKHDPETLTKVRSILASPNLWGATAWDLSEENVIEKAELYMNTLGGNIAAIRLAARRLGHQVLVDTRLGKALGYVPGADSELEQLMECAA